MLFLNPLLKVFDEFCFIVTISKVQKAKVVFYVEVATGADETWLVLMRQLVETHLSKFLDIFV